MTEQHPRHPWYTHKPREPALLTEDIEDIADDTGMTEEQVRAEVFPPFPTRQKEE